MLSLAMNLIQLHVDFIVVITMITHRLNLDASKDCHVYSPVGSSQHAQYSG